MPRINSDTGGERTLSTKSCAAWFVSNTSSQTPYIAPVEPDRRGDKLPVSRYLRETVIAKIPCDQLGHGFSI
jgi:hypothetical protein